MNEADKKIEQFKEIIENSKNIVFMGGAGVSTESGVPDFRGEKGLWNAKTRLNRSPEEIVSHTFFLNRTDDFYEYYMNNLIFPGVKPNTTHYALAKLEEQGKVRAVVTQNIDGLHQAAGSKVVYELHGSIARSYCTKCGKTFSLEYTLDESHRHKGSYTPRCDVCDGVLKPDAVLYEEGLDDRVMAGAMAAISSADTLIVGGTSLVVYPAAGLIRYFRGKDIVLINMQETPYDSMASLVIHDSLGKVFKNVVEGV